MRWKKLLQFFTRQAGLVQQGWFPPQKEAKPIPIQHAVKYPFHWCTSGMVWTPIWSFAFGPGSGRLPAPSSLLVWGQSRIFNPHKNHGQTAGAFQTLTRIFPQRKISKPKQICSHVVGKGGQNKTRYKQHSMQLASMDRAIPQRQVCSQHHGT